VRANFEGIAFDDTGFVKIDLLFAGEDQSQSGLDNRLL
jgi:hypothetical protein